MKKLMIIEDTQMIREELTSLLIKYGYEVIAPDNFENIIHDIKSAKPDLILLDINLPVFDGFYICREIRKDISTPIIIVTSRNSEIDELMSMNLGADDFITKPYNTQILLAHINAVLKRAYADMENSDILSIRDLELDLSRGIIKAFDNTLEISKNELKILSYLIKNKEKIVSRDSLMNYMWNSDIYIDDNTLSVNINRLRKKLSEIGLEDYIETKRGLGYMIK
ncbi:DNA-binding response regulator [Romboutsia ilealis]|uniref:Stage 0 sporulation protein A homolog n=1 Tax=Romboutsia faecis TaxID=2764597 RepID=A0ABR7JT07_9FIRM|nr:response regulator transcription factor [Romboutsia faecis]MBC5997898.1 response regulator transcription factor [Romboutsia faecis]MRN25593.1 DNA-binding response regulator [Romboutsia ilealis]